MPRNLNQRLVGTRHAEPAVLPFGERVTVTEDVNVAMRSIFTITFDNIEVRTFPYLFSYGYNLPANISKAKLIRELLFHSDSRFWCCFDWCFFKYDKIEYDRIQFDGNRVSRNSGNHLSAG
eukprot:NODE_361_length_8796_cov_0.460274.p8 type:complete len:121 gc:universal NODE_361_length_8796_cov_0.460274:7661-8023(+)